MTYYDRSCVFLIYFWVKIFLKLCKNKCLRDIIEYDKNLKKYYYELYTKHKRLKAYNL